MYGRNIKALQSKLEHDLNSLVSWLNTNNLLINAKKTKCILFGQMAKYLDIDVTISGQHVQPVKCFKFLGLYLDNILSFEHHVHLLHSSLLNYAFALQKLGSFVPKDCLRTLYFAHFQSKINYGIHIWFPLTKEGDRNKMFLPQKRLVRNCKK